MKAFFVLIFLILVTTIFLYPAFVWYLPITGAIVSGLGVLLKKKSLIVIGVFSTAGIFYIHSLDAPLSFSTIFIITGYFILFYGSMVYMEELMMRGMIMKETKGDLSDMVAKSRYRKEWNRTLFGNLVFGLFIAFIGSVILWAGSFDFSDYVDHPITFIATLFFIIFSLFLIYVLMIKLPESFEEA